MQSFPKPLTAPQEASYLERYKNGDLTAKNILIEHNLRLVAHIVKKYASSGRETEELISVGIVGLVKAVNTYNFDKGNRLATYAARCIDNELLMLMRGDRKLNREVSLYDPIGTDKEGNEINLLNIIEHESEDIVEKMEQERYLRQLDQLLPKALTPREYQVIVRRYGLYGYEETTQRELAADLGISRSYVSRIEKKALQKLRKHLH
jgi:RNA polymerase sporulation-specific sigma factor